MRNSAARLALIACALISSRPLAGQSGTASNAEPDTALVPDTLFVRSEKDSPSYRRVLGRVLAMGPDYVIFVDSTSEPKLYERSQVAYVALAQLQEPGDTLELDPRRLQRQLIRDYWSRESDLLLYALKAVPVVGNPAAAVLERLPGVVRRFISLLILVSAIACFGMKAYEIVLVNRENARLNRLKLSLDIAKTRQEALKMAEPNSPEFAALSSLEIPLLVASDAFQLRAPQEAVTIPAPPMETKEPTGRARRLFARLGGLMFTWSQRRQQSHIYASEIFIRIGQSGRDRTRRWYRWKMIWMGISAALLWLYGIFGVLAPAMIVVGISSRDTEMITVGVLYLIFLALAIPAFRTTIKRRLLRQAFRTVTELPSVTPAP
jgi:hypothetical protein